MAGDDLEVLDPTPTAVQFRGREVVIKPLKVGKLPAFARAVKPLASAFERIDGLTAADMLELIADHGDSIVTAISIASGIDKAELEDSDPVELLAIVTPVVRANADFFRLRLLMAGKIPAMAGAKKASAGAGPTP